MTDTKICEGCRFWRVIWDSSTAVCHQYLDTGKRRVEEDGECLSFQPRETKGKRGRNRDGWYIQDPL